MSLYVLDVELLYQRAEATYPAGLSAVDGPQNSYHRSAMEDLFPHADAAAAAGPSSSGHEGLILYYFLAILLPDAAHLTMARYTSTACTMWMPLQPQHVRLVHVTLFRAALQVHFLRQRQLRTPLYCRLCGLPQAHLIGRSTAAVTSRRCTACSPDQQLPSQYAEPPSWSCRQGISTPRGFDALL